jgi:1,4-alpha-glucan branching enzyme
VAEQVTTHQMTTSRAEIGLGTAMGANLTAGGATFRVWAPNARRVDVVTAGLLAPPAPAGPAGPAGQRPAGDRMASLGDGTWAAFVAGIGDGSPYLYWVEGDGSSGFKRDPRARELTTDPPFPSCFCLVRDPHAYPWHDTAFRTPELRDLILYQLHVGAFYGVDSSGQDRRAGVARFLDVLDRLEYLRDLGINAVLLLPIQEYATEFSLGYNGTDYFSPEGEYEVTPGAALDERYLTRANALLAARGCAPLTAGQLTPGIHQLKCLVDLLHLHGIAVLFDLVYNHAGGGFDEHSMYFFDRQAGLADQNHSLYFTDRGYAGGLAFALWNRDVRQFLLDNAVSFLDEYHADGIRYDEVSALRNLGGAPADLFCRDLTSTVRFAAPRAIQIAEYWNDDRAFPLGRPPAGLGFDAELADGLRDSIRSALGSAGAGAQAAVDLDAVALSLSPPAGFPAAWSAVQCLENHDVVYTGRSPRVAALCDPADPRSWYARSRARVGAALLLTAPGIPLLFMGQEFLAERQWNDNTAGDPASLISWSDLAADRFRQDYLRFMRDLIALRRSQAALRGESVAVTALHHANRVLAFQRWIEGVGETVVVVASLHEETWRDYRIGFPLAGAWREVFNSDFYDQFPNPQVAGNGGAIVAAEPGLDGLPASAAITIPANGVVVFARA